MHFSVPQLALKFVGIYRVKRPNYTTVWYSIFLYFMHQVKVYVYAMLRVECI